MTNEEVEAHIEILEQHLAHLEGVIHVMLEQIEAGTILESAARIREALQQRDG